MPATSPSLGARYDGRTATFALYSSIADAVELCLFDDAGAESRYALTQGEGFVWQGLMPDARPGPGFVRLHIRTRPGGPHHVGGPAARVTPFSFRTVMTGRRTGRSLLPPGGAGAGRVSIPASGVREYR